jgi:hypothetical protein
MRSTIGLLVNLTVLAALAPGSARAAPADKPVDKPVNKRAQFAQLQQVMKREPNIREVQRATLAYYQLEPERIRAMSTSARLKGLFPEIDAGVDSLLGHNFSSTQDALFPTFAFKERQAASNDQFIWRVRGVWDLSRLVFNPEQLDVKTLNSLQETLIREVTVMYFSRRRVLANLILSPPEDEEDRFFEELRLEEMTATIDAFTGGKFADRAWSGEMMK